MGSSIVDFGCYILWIRKNSRICLGAWGHWRGNYGVVKPGGHSFTSKTGAQSIKGL